MQFVNRSRLSILNLSSTVEINSALGGKLKKNIRP